MNETIEIKKQLEDLIKGYYSGTKSKTKLVLRRTNIPLVVPSYDWEEVCEAIDCLLDAQVTMGESDLILDLPKYRGLSGYIR